MTECAVSATGLMAKYLGAGLISLADFHVGERLGLATGERRELPRLALALAMRAVRAGSVCFDLERVQDTGADVTELPTEFVWPDPVEWRMALTDSPLVTVGADAPGTAPLRLVGQLVYLERFWEAERTVEQALLERREPPIVQLNQSPSATQANPQQNAAIAAVANHQISIITGGPGTGKTHTVAGILASYRDLPSTAIAAPTGKAAARLQESIAAELPPDMAPPVGTTIHALLGLVPSRPYSPRYHAGNPLPHDLVIVDETSMISLVLMGQLLQALRPDARLVMIGDRDQLASVEAGAVLADIVDSKTLLPPTAITRLTQNYRFGTGIGYLAEAIRAGDPEGCLAALDSDDTVNLIDSDPALGLDALPGLATRLLHWAGTLQSAALAKDPVRASALIDDHRLLCAHRDGAWGVSRWNQLIRRWLSGQLTKRYGSDHGWFPGQPLLISRTMTANGQRIWNGDTAVIFDSDEGLRAAIQRGDSPLVIPPHLLENVSDLYAMTIHKAQGSQFKEVSLILPTADSRLLTRELLYTAVTRARQRVTIYGTKDAFRAAVTTPVHRASGLTRD